MMMIIDLNIVSFDDKNKKRTIFCIIIKSSMRDLYILTTLYRSFTYFYNDEIENKKIYCRHESITYPNI
jgi:hypothetical protein